jgi:hypothetical protein
MSSFPQQSIYETLTTLALWTNDTISKGYLSGLGILEETITDYALNEIAALHSQNVYTKKFSKKQEGNESGADWLWCIGNPGHWLPILVQAKIVSPRTKQCHYLDYGTSYGKQGQLLIKYARTHKLLPLYCIYSLIEPDTIPEAMQMSSLRHISATNWACSFIIPKHIQKLIKQNEKSQSSLLRYGIPWMEPFRSNNDKTPVDLAHAISSFLLKLYDEFKNRDEERIMLDPNARDKNSLTTTKIHQGISRIQWANVDPTKLVTPRFPRIAIRLLTSRVRPSDAPIGSISIISNTPLEEVLQIEGAISAPNKVLPLFKRHKRRGVDFW